MKKNKIVNKIGILVLAVMLSILSSITVLASEPEGVTGEYRGYTEGYKAS